MLTTFHARAQRDFVPAPSAIGPSVPKIRAAAEVPAEASSVAVLVCQGEETGGLGLDWTHLRSMGFEGKVGQTLIIPRAGEPALVAVGLGERDTLDLARLRDAAAVFARATSRQPRVALRLPRTDQLAPDVAAQVAVEGVLLARYRYRPLKRTSEQEPPLEALTVIAESSSLDRVEEGVRRGDITARATELARDLAEAPASLLTARRLAELAQSIGPDVGLDVEVFDEEALAQMGCGGLLGVNAGSAEPPRLIKLTYRPKDASGRAVEPQGRICLVGKGIMFDSGGLGLKPNDLVHASMKSDMSGAGAILAAMTTLKALDCKTEVTGYLMCTDNMPSGTAMRLGDVITVRGGKTVEVLNTDAEGRLVMSDGLVLATEQQPRPDAIIDIATLTGACQRALGILTAGADGKQPAAGGPGEGRGRSDG